MSPPVFIEFSLDFPDERLDPAVRYEVGDAPTFSHALNDALIPQAFQSVSDRSCGYAKFSTQLVYCDLPRLSEMSAFGVSLANKIKPNRVFALDFVLHANVHESLACDSAEVPHAFEAPLQRVDNVQYSV